MEKGTERQYRLLSLDMDGTLLDSAKKIPAATAAAMRQLRAQGVEVVLGTGRGLAEVQDYRADIEGMHYGILLSGGMVYDFWQERPAAVHALPLADSLRILAAGEAEGAMVQLLTVRSSVARQQDISRMEDFGMGIYRDMYERVCERCDDMEGYLRAHEGEIVKMNLYHRSAASRRRSREMLAEMEASMVFAEQTALEVSPKGINKAQGLRDLCALLQLPLSAAVAVGDAPNDSEILQAAGCAIAMGNAAADIKALADATVSDNDHGGVLEAMRLCFPHAAL